MVRYMCSSSSKFFQQCALFQKWSKQPSSEDMASRVWSVIHHMLECGTLGQSRLRVTMWKVGLGRLFLTQLTICAIGLQQYGDACLSRLKSGIR